jgi:hypothetical protein
VTYLYGPNGGLVNQAISSSYTEGDWANSFYSNRLTTLDSSMTDGDYRLSIFVNGIKVAVKEFTIEQDAAAIQSAVSAALEEAQRLYAQREYRAAVAACDRALQADPGNVSAADLRTSILKTIEILGIQ